jgi:(p)ppGpp synthase/HD superfamily hydrolase
VRAAAIEVVWRWLDLAGPLAATKAPSSSSSSSGERPQYQQQLLAMEALTIYCPLGHALGLGVCAAGLEDAAFKVGCLSCSGDAVSMHLICAGQKQQSTVSKVLQY